MRKNEWKVFCYNIYMEDMIDYREWLRGFSNKFDFKNLSIKKVFSVDTRVMPPRFYVPDFKNPFLKHVSIPDNYFVNEKELNMDKKVDDLFVMSQKYSRNYPLLKKYCEPKENFKSIALCFEYLEPSTYLENNDEEMSPTAFFWDDAITSFALAPPEDNNREFLCYDLIDSSGLSVIYGYELYFGVNETKYLSYCSEKQKEALEEFSNINIYEEKDIDKLIQFSLNLSNNDVFHSHSQYYIIKISKIETF